LRYYEDMTAPLSPPPSSLERRIKRHMHAPVHDWFAPCAPGLEPALAQELAALGADDIQPTAGGVAFKGKLDVGYAANLWLRTANRVLLRLAAFGARRPEDLFRHAAQLPWELWLSSDVPLRFEVTAFESWLKRDDLIEETLRSAIQKRLAEQQLDTAVAHRAPGGDADDLQRVLIRIERDRVTLSLDASGDHLHRRGYRQATAKAPLRENLAAGALLLAGYDGTMPLCDPMCGSGTFAIEGALIARRLPPGLDRRFLFERWPSFRAATWEFLKRKAMEASLAQPPAPITARDENGGAVRASLANAERAGVRDSVALSQADFFKEAAPGDMAGLIALNPPYGVRIGDEASTLALFRRMGQKLKQAYPGWRYVILAPSNALTDALGLPVSSRVLIPHGGLKITLVFGEIG
jgi:putative N6-adenine-specific DNA methylase